MSFAFLSDWTDLLPREGGHLVAVSGFGGKSALIEAMAGFYAAAGIPAVVSAPGFEAALPRLDWSEIGVGVVTPPLFEIVDSGGPLDAVRLDALGERLPDHVVLAEIGSGNPAPLPVAAAPVWPGRTSLAVVVAGLAAVDRPRDRIDPLGLLPDSHFTETDRGQLWSWPGLLRWCEERALPDLPADVPAALALLQLDACDDALGLFETIGRFMDEKAVPVVLIGDTSGPEPRLRTAYRTEEV